MKTARDVIENALHLYGILDQTEHASTIDIANNVIILNDLLRSEHADGAAQYLMSRVSTILPATLPNMLYTFMIGTASPSYLVQVDAVAVRSIWCSDTNMTVNRETRQAPIADVVRTTHPGTITKWHQERQVDGSICVTAWQPPRSDTACLIEYGGRVGALINPDGSDIVTLPPEGIHDATLMLGRRIFSTYGRSQQAVAAILSDSELVNRRWRDWAKGQQWLRFVRS